MIRTGTTGGARARRRIGAVGLVAAVALLLSGCFPDLGGLFPKPAATSTPTGEQVSAELQPFYSQILEWKGCGEKLECSTAKAPLDWDDPAAGEIELALVRHRATGERIGSLLVNPGGPGASGVDLVSDSLDFAVGQPLQERFDIVGFDPRGVGQSSSVVCYDAAGMDEALFTIPPGERGSPEWIAASSKNFEDFGAACAENTGELLGYVDTVSAARDLDLLRAVLGDTKLNYLGYSYGTFLGATFAGLYPDKVGRLVLDGAIDPAASEFEVSKAQAVGFEQALRAYMADCQSSADCPFSGDVDAGMAEVGALAASLDASPLRGSDGRMVGADTYLTAIIAALYSPDSWTYLSQMFDSVMLGDADMALTLADFYYGRNPDGTYSDNSTEAFRAINCLDYPLRDGEGDLQAEAAEITAAAPVIGPYWGYDTGGGCELWPVQGDATRAAIHAEGADPILVIGTTGDPATPYEWAVSLAEQLDSGVLVSYEGEGHTAYNKSNACVNDAVEQYFIDGTVPASDPKC
ncbi:alpha/beta hydrolase [Agromyces soli]|uniref:Alpha/beta hydrolase n=1 Tax=Agromyces soli TaxID=659012 RepID=A0ABY4APV3_9MICO|nr:alpha/beta hydrolase [Agromyces soli]UOE24839.1 alpha/beta hydrolase [Agromyces soli]